MTFTSFHFLIFFFIALLFGHTLKNRAQKVFLLFASYYFYGVFEPWYLVLIITSSSWDYMAAIGIESYDGIRRGEVLSGVTAFLGRVPRKVWLYSSLVFNLSLLGYFKYTNFGIEIFNDLQPLGGTIFSWPITHVLLPVGISFYTFQSLSYTIDIYRGIMPARRNYLDFALYVAFFPQLVAGPIVRATTFFEQLDRRPPITREDIITGFTRIVVGFFRKLVLSDNLSVLVDTIFRDQANLHPADIWIGAFAFGFQIYFDFAGYTDIARGVARLFGFEFPINFLYPMAAKNITDHWKRWHISLTTWIRDYVYIPLGGSRISTARTYLNIFIIWVLTGIWHGAAFHFVIWGFWQAIMMSVHRAYTRLSFHDAIREKGGVPYDVFARLFTYFNLAFGFIFFRAETLEKSLQMIGRLFGMDNLPGALRALFHGGATQFGELLAGHTPFPAPQYGRFSILIALYFLYDLVLNKYQLEYFREERNRWKYVAYVTTMLYCIIAFASPETPNFLYFQF